MFTPGVPQACRGSKWRLFTPETWWLSKVIKPEALNLEEEEDDDSS
jgi:hypothetical protein